MLYFSNQTDDIKTLYLNFSGEKSSCNPEHLSSGAELFAPPPVPDVAGRTRHDVVPVVELPLDARLVAVHRALLLHVPDPVP